MFRLCSIRRLTAPRRRSNGVSLRFPSFGDDGLVGARDDGRDSSGSASAAAISVKNLRLLAAAAECARGFLIHCGGVATTLALLLGVSIFASLSFPARLMSRLVRILICVLEYAAAARLSAAAVPRLTGSGSDPNAPGLTTADSREVLLSDRWVVRLIRFLSRSSDRAHSSLRILDLTGESSRPGDFILRGDATPSDLERRTQLFHFTADRATIQRFLPKLLGFLWGRAFFSAAFFRATNSRNGTNPFLKSS